MALGFRGLPDLTGFGPGAASPAAAPAGGFNLLGILGVAGGGSRYQPRGFVGLLALQGVFLGGAAHVSEGTRDRPAPAAGRRVASTTPARPLRSDRRRRALAVALELLLEDEY